jgi:hypothetical protein
MNRAISDNLHIQFRIAKSMLEFLLSYSTMNNGFLKFPGFKHRHALPVILSKR